MIHQEDSLHVDQTRVRDWENSRWFPKVSCSRNMGQEAGKQLDTSELIFNDFLSWSWVWIQLPVSFSLRTDGVHLTESQKASEELQRSTTQVDLGIMLSGLRVLNTEKKNQSMGLCILVRFVPLGPAKWLTECSWYRSMDLFPLLLPSGKHLWTQC